jgi:hypothetical protein
VEVADGAGVGDIGVGDAGSAEQAASSTMPAAPSQR